MSGGGQRGGQSGPPGPGAPPREDGRPSMGSLVGVDGLRLRTLSWSAPAPRGQVLVVHGLGEHAGRMELLARGLLARGYAVMAYDQRGHGESAGPRGHSESFDLFVGDLARAAAALEGSSSGPAPLFVYGHSMGGLVVLRWLQSADASPRGVVLSAPWLRTAAPVPRWKELLAGILRRVAPSLPVATGLAPEILTRDADRQQSYLSDRLIGRGLSVALYDGVRAAQARVLGSAKQISVPTLVLLPSEDRVADAACTERWAERAGPQVRVMRLQEFRHEPHNELGRDGVFTRVADWMDQQRGPNPGGPRG